MDWLTVAKQIDPVVARSFVEAARHVVDAMLVEAERIKQTQSPGARDYNAGTLSREAPPGGWISHAELRDTAQKMAEAITTEKWVDGFIAAVQIMSLLGGAL